MDNLSAAWLYPIIIIAGVLQAWGPPMNNALKKALVNPWLGSLVWFLPIVAFLSVVLMWLPRPLPTAGALSQMPWWAPLDGFPIVGIGCVNRSHPLIYKLIFYRLDQMDRFDKLFVISKKPMRRASTPQ